MSSTIDPSLAMSYAALILVDAGVSITPEKLQSLLSAAKIENVEPIWSTIFAKALEGKDVNEILLNAHASGPAVAAAPADNSAGADIKASGGPEEKKDEAADKDEDSDEDGMGMDLFGFD